MGSQYPKNILLRNGSSMKTCVGIFFMPVFAVFLFFVGQCRGADLPEYRTAEAREFVVRGGLPNVIAKMEKGEPVRIAYFGGSITAQSGWRVQTLKWFQERFPKAQFSEINAAIGGTGSDLGVFRLGFDVLSHDPDLVFVEFAVNDGGASPESIWRSMEGIVRQIWKKNGHIDIAYVYTFRLGYEKETMKGECPKSISAMEQLADFYGIPSINFNIPTVKCEQEGKLVYQSETPVEGKIQFSTDGVHPLPEGHQIYTKAVADAMTKMIDSPAPPFDHSAKLTKVFITDNWEKAKMVPIKQSMLSGNWSKLPEDSPLWKSFHCRLGDSIYTASEPGSALKFRFKGSDAKIYDLLGPNGGQVYITVDSKRSTNAMARFDSYCTYHRIATLRIAANLQPDEIHEVVVEIDAKQPDRQPVAFRLKDPNKELLEPKYQGTNVWFAQLMLLGDLVEE